MGNYLIHAKFLVVRMGDAIGDAAFARRARWREFSTLSIVGAMTHGSTPRPRLVRLLPARNAAADLTGYFALVERFADATANLVATHSSSAFSATRYDPDIAAGTTRRPGPSLHRRGCALGNGTVHVADCPITAQAATFL